MMKEMPSPSPDRLTPGDLTAALASDDAVFVTGAPLIIDGGPPDASGRAPAGGEIRSGGSARKRPAKGILSRRRSR